LSRNKLYGILAIACLAGYIWLFVSFQNNYISSKHEIDVCLVKQILNIPCPSCGSTRSIEAIFQGNFKEALLWNPFGFLVLGIMIAIPLMLIIDFFYKKDLLLQYYLRFENLLKHKKVAIPAILLLISNWVWNIYKDV
jgi:hypothetical protein